MSIPRPPGGSPARLVGWGRVRFDGQDCWGGPAAPGGRPAAGVCFGPLLTTPTYPAKCLLPVCSGPPSLSALPDTAPVTLSSPRAYRPSPRPPPLPDGSPRPLLPPGAATGNSYHERLSETTGGHGDPPRRCTFSEHYETPVPAGTELPGGPTPQSTFALPYPTSRLTGREKPGRRSPPSRRSSGPRTWGSASGRWTVTVRWRGSITQTRRVPAAR